MIYLNNFNHSDQKGCTTPKEALKGTKKKEHQAAGAAEESSALQGLTKSVSKEFLSWESYGEVKRLLKRIPPDYPTEKMARNSPAEHRRQPSSAQKIQIFKEKCIFFPCLLCISLRRTEAVMCVSFRGSTLPSSDRLLFCTLDRTFFGRSSKLHSFYPHYQV